jgi:hypothetical protein
MWKRLSVVGLLGVASTGCFQSHGALMRGASNPPSPMAFAPAASPDTTIDGGVVKGQAVAQTATASRPGRITTATLGAQAPRLPESTADATSSAEDTDAVAVASAGG